jgi:hypothetical protein
MAIAVCWLLILPLAAQRPIVRRHIKRNEFLGVDPSAKFYTELPAMPAIADRVDRIRNLHGRAFWSRSVQ